MKKVKCINASQGWNFLNINQTYEVEREYDSSYGLHYKLVGNSMGWLQSRFEVVSDNSTPAISYGLTDAIKLNNSVAINNHICPHCQNNRCSKSERSCWKCGGTL